MDIGYSRSRPSTGLCLIDSTAAVPVRSVHVRASETLRAARALLGRSRLVAVGIDGPLRPDLRRQRAGRECERRLTGSPFRHRCQPGSVATPLGQRLHAEATRVARALARDHPAALRVEAFPTAFLRTLLPEHRPGRVPRGDKAQVYWACCLRAGALGSLVARLFPGGAVMAGLAKLRQRDERAAAVCALTARAAALGWDTRVGVTGDGWISLGPRRFLADWARRAL